MSKKNAAVQKPEYLPAEVEKALEPFGLNQPYDLNLRIQQGKWLLKQQVNIHFNLGCILLEIKERENLQTFVKILSDEFGGMGQATAYHYMLFARKCQDLPKIREFAENNWSKALALLHSNTSEQLQEIEANGLDGKSLDEYDGLSVAEYKALLKERTDRLKTADIDAHSKYQKEISSLQKQLKSHEKKVDLKAAEKQLCDIEEAFARVDDLLSNFFLAPNMVGCDALQARAAGMQKAMETRFRKFHATFSEYIGAGAKK